MKQCPFCHHEFKNLGNHQRWCPDNPDCPSVKPGNESRRAIKRRSWKKKQEESPEIECECGCGSKLKSVDEYGRPATFINGHNNRKYDDPTQYKREWNHRNRRARYQYKKNYGWQRKARLLELLGNKCEDCERLYDGTNASGFDFHHMEKKKMYLCMSNLIKHKWDDILEEAKKCALLCAYCHRIRHSGKY